MTDQLDIMGESPPITAADLGALTWRSEVGGQVIPWQRTGGRGGARFTPKRTRDYQETVATVASFRRPDAWPYMSEDQRFGLTLTFYMKNRIRRDLDNCEKTICDALNGIAWRDDCQIDEVHKYRRHDKENPRVVIEIVRLT